MPQTHATSTDDALVAACPRCGTQNRFPRRRLDDGPVCGSCKSKLLPPEPVTGTDANFTSQVLASPVPVIVDFWAPWCGPCRMMEKPLQDLAKERAPHLKVVKVNVDENPHLAARYRVQSIPQMAIFEGGALRDQVIGAQPKAAIEARLDALNN